MTQHTKLALATFAVGFVVEAGTEVYQFLSSGSTASSGAGVYYFGLATTVVGFYLIYRGRTEWTEEHRRLVRHGHRAAGVALAIFAAATVAIAVVGTLTGADHGAPFWMGAFVGGAVALAIANFFLGLLLLVYRLVGPVGRIVGASGFVWALVVAVLTGSVVSQRFLSLLDAFVTNPLSLVTSFAPLAFTMAPLFVTYALYTAAYGDAFRSLSKTSHR